ncbi:hypothetical protein [Kitasatospora sp. NPDC094011]|uniref:hypothetical protein n=1 Tax=Kitasatospora sp. NPDC094011 TaxID=3364090 RepID=UPI0038087917
MNDRERGRVSDLLGLTGTPRAGGRWAGVVDVTAIVAALLATASICRALGLDTWLAALIGGCAGALTLRLDLGTRIVRGRRD